MRRLAADAASGAQSYELIERVAEEVIEGLGAEACAIFRYDGEEVVMVGGSAAPGHRMFTRGTRFPIEESPISKAVRASGEPVLMSAYTDGEGAGPRRVAALGYRTVVGAPILVEGRLWGSLTAATEREESLPPGSEHRLVLLADICAVALVSSDRLRQLEAQTAEQGAALAVSRSVLVQPQTEPVLSVVAREAAKLLGLTSGAVIRFHDDGDELAAEWRADGDTAPVALPDPVAELVRARRAAVAAGDPDATAQTDAPAAALGRPVGWGVPLEIEQRLWGALVVAGDPGLPVPSDAADRLQRFAHLSALAVAHVEARSELVRQLVQTEQFAALVSGSSDFIALAEPAGRVVYVNPAGLRLVGLESLEEATGHLTRDFITPESAAATSNAPREALSATGTWQGEAELRHFRTGEAIPVSINSVVIAHPVTSEPVLFGTIMRDLRERKAAESQLRRRADEVEELAAARRFLLVEALSSEERMRRQIGDALHDDVLQELYAARQDLQEVVADDEALHRARVAVDAASRQLREAVRDLHPAVSWTRDLEARLQSILEEGRTRAGFAFRLDFEADATSGADDLVLALARELVHNVVKHAQAREVTVRVHEDPTGLVLEVADDGHGMPAERPAQALRAGHIGLASARERVDALGGNFELASEPGAGTRVRVVVPRDGVGDVPAQRA